MTGSNQDDQSRRADEMKLMKRFMDAIQNHLDQIRLRGDAGSFKLEDKERQILYEINNFGLIEGFTAGCLSLFLLRRSRAAFLRRLQKRQEMPHQGPPGSSTTASEAPPRIPNSPFQQSSSEAFHPPTAEVRRVNSGLPFLFGWVLDLMLSFSLAVTASAYFTDRKKVFEKLSTIPLVEGRSKVSTEFCPVVLHELEQVCNEDPHNKELMREPVTFYLQGIKEFSENCKLRAAYERKLRREKGVSEAYPVLIPPPGVPKDLALQFMSSSEDGTEEWGSGSSGENQFYEPESNEFSGDSTEWADSLTSDREDSR